MPEQSEHQNSYKVLFYPHPDKIFVSSFNEDDKFNNESHDFILKVNITVGKEQT